MSAEDFPGELAGFLGFMLNEEARESICALCGKLIRSGEPRRIREDGQSEHLECPER